MDAREFVELRMNGFTRRLLVVLTGLLAVIAVELWVLQPGGPPRAQAQIPDTGMQRKQLIDETRRTNDLLQRILDQLQHNTIKVRLERSDKPDGTKSRPASP